MNETRDMEEARIELERRVQLEGGRYYVPNGKIAEVLDVCKIFERKAGVTYKVLFRAGNGVGKTAFGVMLAGYLSSRFPNPWFDDIPFLKNFKRRNRGRIVTTPNAAAKSYDEEYARWFPAGSFKLHKDDHLYTRRVTWPKSRSWFDILTHDQKPIQGESVTLDWAIVDEPMKKKHWGSLSTRFRFGGIIFFLLTPLDGSAWMEDTLEVPSRLERDVFVVQGSTEDNCIEHGIRGILPHQYASTMSDDFDEDELGARKDGEYLTRSGRIYKAYRHNTHVIPELPKYHDECYKTGNYTLARVIDPHDRKPFAIGWYLIFPNDDVITVAEWPNHEWPDFHRIKSCKWMASDYAKEIKAVEQEIGRKAQIYRMDPNFGKAAVWASDENVTEALERELKAIDWGGVEAEFPSDAIQDGHQAVKGLLGDPEEGIRPKFYILEGLHNHDHQMSRYGWKENQGDDDSLSERIQMKYKDFPDLVRYLAIDGAKHINRQGRKRAPPWVKTRNKKNQGGYRGVS